MIAVESGSEEWGRAGRRVKDGTHQALEGWWWWGVTEDVGRGGTYWAVGTRERRRSNRDLSLDLWVCKRVSGGWWEMICREGGGGEGWRVGVPWMDVIKGISE